MSSSFIDPFFVACHELPTKLVSLLPLSLINGTVSNFVKEIVTLPIKLACGLSFELNLFVTPLAEEYPIVLGYSWLQSMNPTIDWVKNTLRIPQTCHPKQILAPPIALIGAVAFKRACRQRGSVLFQLAPTPSGSNYARASTLLGENAKLTELPEEYMEFSDVFSKNKAKQLLPHHDHDLSIQIKGNAIPPLGPIYSLSAIEQKTLHEFINKNLKSGVIRPSNSPCSSLVLFIRKKDGLL